MIGWQADDSAMPKARRRAVGQARKNSGRSAHVMLWSIMGSSVRGAAHTRMGKPNQDAIAWTPAGQAAPTAMLAVSDGHGSAPHFRSGVGAHFAVHVALQTLTLHMEQGCQSHDLTLIKQLAEQRWPAEITRAWNEAAAHHLLAAPFSEEELSQAEQGGGQKARQALTRHPALAYGATLLCAVVTPAFLLTMQIGDGDLLAISSEKSQGAADLEEFAGKVTRPVPADPRCLGVETPSLCAPNAWRDFRVGFQTLAGAPPALIMASTDGYANSFADEAAFERAGLDMLASLRQNGRAAVEAGLPAWLAETSQAGSGDDITVGLIVNTPAFTAGIS